MSEYQFYEFRTVRHPLTRDEQAEVNTWSSRGKVSATGASFVYNYGDFRHDPERCLLGFFDMMLYLSNWGHRRLMFRFPEKEVDFQTLKQFEWKREMDERSIEVYKKGGFVVIDIDENLDGGFDDWVEGEGVLPTLTPLWTEIFQGNYACLYLAWMHFAAKYQAAFDDPDDEDFEDADELTEPPVPAGLKNATAALTEFMNFWDISKDLFSAAAAASPAQNQLSPADFEHQINHLSAKEKTDFLVRLLHDEPAAVRMDLQKRLLQFSKNGATATAPRRSLQEILDLESQHASRRRDEEQRKAAEKRFQELEVLKKRQPQAWKAVETNLLKQTASGYDHAVAELKDLRDLAVHVDKKAEFAEKLSEIRERFGKSRAFLNRLQNAGLI